MNLDVVVYFFILGLIGHLVNPKVTFPEGVKKALTIILLLIIGLKGGIALKTHASLSLLYEVGLIVSVSVVFTLCGFLILKAVGGFNTHDAASLSAHYGSVSVATFAVATFFLELSNINYEPYFPLFVAILEVPAIFVALFLVSSHQQNPFNTRTIKEIFLNESIIYLIGAMVIGAISNEQIDKIMRVFTNGFSVILALFLFAMGIQAASGVKHIKESSSFLIAYALFMPLLGGLLGALTAHILEFSLGGALLLTTLFASGSYIAVPAAMSVAMPQANNGQAITASLVITFPFNVVIGITTYYQLLLHFY